MRRTALIALMSAMVGALVATPVAVYASHRFTDVPDTNIFHDDISWLADTGITRGCNPPANDEFCPDDYVTREQLAAFLHRFANAGVGFDPSRLYANWYREWTEESDRIGVGCDEGDVLLSGATELSPSFEGYMNYVDGPISTPLNLWTMPDPYPNIGPHFQVNGPFTGWWAEVTPLGPVPGHWAVVAYCYDVP